MYVQQDDYSYHCHVVHLKIAKRVNPKSAHHKEENFSLPLSSLYLYEIMDVS